MVSKQRAMILGGVAIMAAVGWWWFTRSPTVTAQTALATVGPLRVTIDETGTTRVRAHTDVSAPVSGRWVPVELREGDMLKAGARLGLLFPAPLDGSARTQMLARVGSAGAQVKEAEAQVAAARTALEEARRAATRATSLGNVGGIAPQDVERARDLLTLRDVGASAANERLRVARYQLAQAQAALDGATGRADGLPLAAPMDGAILTVAEPHERVVPAGARLLEIGDPRDVEIVVPLLTSDALRVKEGAPVQVTFGAGATTSSEGTRDTVAGKVQRIEPSAYTRLSALGVEEQRVNVVVSVPSTAVHVGDHFRADARITVWEAPQVLRVPVSALSRDGDAWTVWVVKGGRAERQIIRVGERGTEQAEIREGLQRGDSVVLFPGDLLPGARVRAP